jgi:adenosylhomocysteinase
MGAHVIITEVDPIKAIEAAMDGFQVKPMIEAAGLGDLFCTLTGDIHVLRKEHYEVMKDRAVLANSGHFNVEIDIEALRKMAKKTLPGVRKNVDGFVLPDGRTLYLLAEGRLINLAAAEGHPASVMDMSFSTQALCAEWVVKSAKRPEVRVHDVPAEIEDWVSRLKLESMGIRIDELTGEQKEYLSSWKIGT